jgi:hypothetical protein
LEVAPPDRADHATPSQTRAPIIEAFVKGAKAEVGLINAVQVYCYADTRMLKAFPQIIKVLYNTDCISDQAIIYWHQKGAKPQGKQHFLKVTEALVKVRERDSDWYTRVPVRRRSKWRAADSRTVPRRAGQSSKDIVICVAPC